MTAEALLYSPAKADFGGLLGLFRHPLVRTMQRTPGPFAWLTRLKSSTSWI
jgi:hypothetical protein